MLSAFLHVWSLVISIIIIHIIINVAILFKGFSRICWKINKYVYNLYSPSSNINKILNCHNAELKSLKLN